MNAEKIQRMCHTKLRYFTELDAKITAAKRHRAGPLHVYQCPICQGWHLTKRPPQQH